MRGSATLLALVVLVVLTTLAISLHAMVGTSVQVTRNELAIMESQAAAESGIEVLKAYMSQVSLSPDVDEDERLGEIAMELLGLGADVETVSANGFVTEIYLPRRPNWIQLFPAPNQSAFQARLTMNGEYLLADVVGWNGQSATSTGSRITRTIYAAWKEFLDGKGSGVFRSGGMSTAGGVSLGNNTRITGNNGNLVVGSSASRSITIGNNAYIPGTIYVTKSESQVEAGNNAIVGSVEVTDFPVLPDFDPSVFRSLATNYISVAPGNNSTVSNICIAAGSNLKFGNNVTIRGIVYVESPNRISFGNNARIEGVIIFEKSSGTPGTDTFTIPNNATFGPIPGGSQYDAVREATAGYAILAPTAAVTINNNLNVNGSIIADTISINNNASATLNDGIILAYSSHANAITVKNNGELTFNSSGEVTVPSQGISDKAARAYAYDPAGYREVVK